MNYLCRSRGLHFGPAWTFSLAVGILGTGLLAQNIPVVNPSFESPQVPPGFPALPSVSGWQKNPAPPPEFGIPADQWENLAGIFPNPAVGDPRHITNLDGNQVAFLFAVPGVSLFQETASPFTAGLSYTLDVGVRGGGALTPGTEFKVSLYYVSAGSRVPLNSTTIVATAGLVTTTELENVRVSVPTVQIEDAWAGKNLGVELSAATPNGAAGIAYWEIDKVQVSSVPEPKMLALLAAGAAVLTLAVRRRSTA